MHDLSYAHRDTAIKYAEQKKGMDINIPLFESLIYKVADLKDSYDFEEAMRFALNELHVREKEERRLYRCAIGKYFNPRAQAAKKARARKKLPPKQKTPRQKDPRRYVVLEKKTGQFALKI